MPKQFDIKNFNDDFLDDIWGLRAEGLPLPKIDLHQPARHEDILYLLNRYPYLQIISTDPQFPPVIEPKFIKAKSGWIIHDYGAAMSSSLGQDLLGSGNPEPFPLPLENTEDEGGSDIGELIGGGTIVNQAFHTAQQMILIAMEKGWPAVDIISGTAIMQWAAWMAAEDHQYNIGGYVPSMQDIAKRERIVKARSEQVSVPSKGMGKRR